MFKDHIIKKFLSTFEHIEYGSISITMPDQKNYVFSGDEKGENAEITIHNHNSIVAFAQKGDIGFAETYQIGWWDSKDLSKLFLFALQNHKLLDLYIYGSFLEKILTRFAYIFTQNTIKGSKKNILAHYDLGNDFYQLWLDPSMTYSSAIFANKTDDLQIAQYNKYDRIIDRISSSGSLLEIGCGWGGFAERALSKNDYGIKGLTISNEQFKFAKDRLGSNVNIALEDYRIQDGKYDNIVSIEMFEAVGEKFWPVYFAKIKSLLANKGKAVIQTITINDRDFDHYRKVGDPIRSFIFPGGLLPSEKRFFEESQKAGLAITNKYAFGKDYALTLQNWLQRFDDNIQKVKALGFDEKFIRMWRFYLNFCNAGFLDERTNVMQIELQHA